jgi:hypothetical protein
MSSSVIAMIWDFDNTLIKGHMQKPLFEKYGVDSGVFWDEVDNLVEFYKTQGEIASPDSVYLNHILNYVQQGIFQNLNNQMLYELGKRLELCEGMPQFFDNINLDIQELHPNISLEHYIISTGFAATIRGSQISEHVKDIWGAEFLESIVMSGYRVNDNNRLIKSGKLEQIGVSSNMSSKLSALFEIHKGLNTITETKTRHHYSRIFETDTRIPFENMIYIGDGETDIPVFYLLSKLGGSSFGVYHNERDKNYQELERLYDIGLIKGYNTTDYSFASNTYNILREEVLNIINNIIRSSVI